MDIILQLGIVISSLIILYYAYFKKSVLAKLIVFVLLGAILVSNFLGLLGQVDFLDFLDNAFNVLKSFIIFIEIGLNIFLVFFKMKEKHTSVLKITTIVLIVLLLLVEFNIF
jgi:hypothetical protein